MMMFPLSPATDAWFQEHERLTLPTVLEPISPHFSIPQLNDKPQDPVIQTIQSSATLYATTRPRSTPSPAPPHPNLFSDTLVHSSEPTPISLWNEASQPHPRNVDRSMSWNPNPTVGSRTSPFLAEQHSCLWNSLQHRAQPSIQAKSTNVVRTTERDLFNSLHLVVLGTSSPLYTWDAHLHSFVPAESSDLFDLPAHNGMSRSTLQRFLDLGTLVRRLDELVRELRGRRQPINTTVHAFAHSLSCVLTFIRNRLSCGPLSYATGFSGACFATVWLYYAELEQIVISLTSMCSRSMDTTPDRFSGIPDSPANLLSFVYETFEKHVECHSPRNITAIMAYILTVSSKPYIQTLCQSLAFGDARQVHVITTERNRFMDTAFQLEGGEAESFWRGEGSVDLDGPFPGFIPENLARILPVAHRSLKLLEAAKPEHPIFSPKSPSEEISWIWTEEGIEGLWNGLVTNNGRLLRGTGTSNAPSSDSLTKQSPDSVHGLVSEFRIFDLEPESFSPQDRDSQAALNTFIVKFPNTLPHITPTPLLLCEVVFTPLEDHAASLSRALLAVFLDRSSSLCIDAHLELLRSHMLLTSHSFKSRLTTALFSDSADRTSHSVQLYNLLRYKSKGTSPADHSHAGRWPVGLAPLLVTRDSWPPGGSELSFLLRTVIVDSQQINTSNVESTSSDSDGARRVIDEAEFRLGFAIRELSGGGHERWLDPLSIEALDFLYLDYKVPQPLQALIPTAVLSKYQRMFAFLLRLTRVECAIRSVFRLTRATAIPLFPTLSSSRGLLLRFRFAAHAFLDALSAYIYGTAIGGNFDTFLLRISACREAPDAPSGFKDVFAFAECHSSVLNDILSACLLRSSQRAAGDLLRGTLEVILEFCVLVGDLKDGRTEEYLASSALGSLYVSFRKKASALMRAMETILEKYGKSRGSEGFQVAHPEWESREPPGGVDALRHLLTCLNQNDWWMNF